MLILTPQEIELCFVQAPGLPPMPGIRFQRWCFYFEQAGGVEMPEALAWCQRWLDEPPLPHRLPALLKEGETCRLCLHSPQVQETTERDALMQACDYMRNAQDFTIGNRRWKLRIYPKTFVGSEAVTWMTQHLHMSREEAVQFGQKCLEQGLLAHVLGEHGFKDEELFYRFSKDGGQDQRVVS